LWRFRYIIPGRQATSMQDKDSSVRLLLADDHAIAREGVKTMLTSEPDLKVVGEAKDGREALNLCWRLEPDLVLMDVRMPEINGLEATREIRVRCPNTNVLVLTTYEDPDYLFEAVRAGAAGYVIKDATKQELVDAIRRTLRGKNSLDHELAMRLLQHLGREAEQREPGLPRPKERLEPLPEPLTPRELEIVRLLAKGLTNRQISQELTISAATVKVHIEHLLAKLKVSDRTQAAVRASQAGLLDPPQ
jgi:DNA-binding NarL/FixJ family response regulator